MNKLDFCGIEVSAEKLVVALQRDGVRQPQREFANTPWDHQALCRSLLRAGRSVRVCLESTGVYGLDLALALSRHPGLEVMVANPRAVRHFATALMRSLVACRADLTELLEDIWMRSIFLSKATTARLHEVSTSPGMSALILVTPCGSPSSTCSTRRCRLRR
jgi:transposase